MTKQLIPYAFVPGTKAKADEINANFISLAATIQTTSENIQQNLNSLSEEIKAEINLKPDKTELNDTVVTEAGTSLDSYKTNGTYIFTEDVKPTELPTDVDPDKTVFDAAGTLIVIGSEDSALKQIWFSNVEHKPIFTREYNTTEKKWQDWLPLIGKNNCTSGDNGYIYLQNGTLIQWGYSASKSVIYPIAYQKIVYAMATKCGVNSSCTRCDTGFTDRTFVGHYYETIAHWSGQMWLTIGK